MCGIIGKTDTGIYLIANCGSCRRAVIIVFIDVGILVSGTVCVNVVVVDVIDLAIRMGGRITIPIRTRNQHRIAQI